MAKKPGLTMAEHEKLGKILKDMRQALNTSFVQVANAYPTTNKRAMRALRKLGAAQNAIDQARSDLEDCMADEHKSEWTTKIYYGGNL